ncbi:MAG: nitroreductase/quinone reductase family protein [Mycobacteriales bacterium]
MTAFPDARWGSDSSWLRGPAIAFSSTRAGSWVIRTLTPLDRRILTRTKGRYTVLGPIGAPTLLLTTTGAKSGLARTTPLLYGRLDDSLVVVGSNFGQDHHPAWTGNLIKQRLASVAMAGQEIAVRATLLDGAEAQAAYAVMEHEAATYTEYRSRTDREIRVFRLSAIGSVG